MRCLYELMQGVSLSFRLWATVAVPFLAPHWIMYASRSSIMMLRSDEVSLEFHGYRVENKDPVTGSPSFQDKSTNG